MKDYPSVNYFLEYTGLSLENSDIDDIKKVLLNQAEDGNYHPSREFVDFNIVHLYVLSFLLIQENVINPRLLKTPRVMARILLIISNGTPELLDMFFGILSHYHSMLSQFSKMPSQTKREKIIALLNDFNFNEILLQNIQSNFRFNRKIESIYSFLVIKLKDFIITEKEKYGTVPKHYSHQFQPPIHFPLMNPFLFPFFPPPPQKILFQPHHPQHHHHLQSTGLPPCGLGRLVHPCHTS